MTAVSVAEAPGATRASELASRVRRSALLLGLGVAMLYGAVLPPYVLTPDERSMLEVSRSVVTGRGVEVPEGLGTVGRDGRVYSNWYPLNSVLAIPVVALAEHASAASELPPHYVAAPFVIAWTAMLTATVCALAMLAAVSWGAPPTMALAWAVAYPFGTVALLYGRSFFAESLLGGLTLVAAWAAFMRGRRAATLEATVCALAVLAKPAGLVVAAALALSHILGLRPARALGAVAGGTAGLTVYLIYNELRFAHPWTFGQPWGSFTAAAIPEALAGLLVSPGRGLLWYSPVVVLAIGTLAWRAWAQRAWTSPATVALLVFAGYLSLHSLWDQWAGGWSWGPRLLMPAFPVLVAAAASSRASGRALLVAGSLGLLVGIPTLLTTVSRTMTLANEQGYSIAEQLWTFSASPLVLSWTSALQQVHQAGAVAPAALVRSSGACDGTLACAEAFQVLPLWWCMLPAAGVPTWVGGMTAVLLAAGGFAALASAWRTAGACPSRP
jgi:hypothetical protein